MAKVRVYELARNLNMTSKALLEKLKELNISVISHVSSLEDEDIQRIKESLFGKKAGMEVTRVKPTVIRKRRKKAVQPKSSEPPQETEDFTPETKSMEAPPSDTQLSETMPEKSDVEPVEPESTLDTGGEKDGIEPPAPSTDIEKSDADEVAAPPKETDTLKAVKPQKNKEKTKKRLPKEEPAKIIKLPEPSVETPEQEPVTDKAAETADEKPVQAPSDGRQKSDEVQQKVSEEKPASSDGAEVADRAGEQLPSEKEVLEPKDVAPMDVVEPAVETTQKASETDKEKKVKAPAQTTAQLEKTEADKARKPEQPQKKATVLKKEKPKKGKKKIKKDTPAKIIKLGPIPPKDSAVTDNNTLKKKDKAVSPGMEKQESQQAVAKTAGDIRDKRKKGGKKKYADESKDKKDKELKWSKKRISFKRKEVVEGSDLYANGPRMKKGKKAAKQKAAQVQKPQITTPKAIKRRIKIDDTIVLSDLAKRMGIKANDMIAKLMTMGVMVTVNQTIDFDTAALVASEFGYDLEKASFEEEAVLKTKADDPGKLEPRPPVVTIMGHVDHGKTSLLDVIRKTRITEHEAGGITQHIGAYSVSIDNGQITFLDTPGHEAFTAMRARGAMVTDIVVLVVAADDGVMPQTVEAINHARAADVPIIVAVNKIDKANADVDRVYRELSEEGLVPEDWGGDTIFVKVSAKQNKGIDELLEMILLQAEVLELKANPDKLAVGYVVEAKLDSGRGAVATILVQEGTLRSGDSVVCGIHYGKIRAMINDRGVNVDSAGPSVPVEILGLSGVPNAGDELVALDDEKAARQVSLHRIQKQRSKELAKTSRLSLEKLFEKMQQGEVKDLNLIIKADVHGSIEALRDSLTKLSNEEVTINIIHSATGTITESDVSLASVSNAIIIGFNVRPSSKVQAMAAEEHVDLRFHNVIYDVIKEIQSAIVGMMESTFEERILGKAEIRQVFHVPKMGAVAGSYVLEGKVQRGAKVRVLRDGVVLYDGIIASLRRFKDDVKEVLTGYECGIGIENYNDIKVGDVLECYYLEEIKPEL